MSILEQICTRKREDLDKRRRETSLDSLERAIAPDLPAHIFRAHLDDFKQRGAPAIIAEIKKASPSAGLIRPDFDVAGIAGEYERGGAACLSVLTDAPYFDGRDDYIRQAKEACALPVLRKDFMIDPYQIVESRALGADCILIIMAAVDDKLAAEMMAEAQRLGMDTLVETHNMEELDRALKLNPDILGINSRDLKSQTTDFKHFDILAGPAKDVPVTVAESGIRSSEDIARLIAAGYHAFLIGEYFMRQKDIYHAMQDMLALPSDKKGTKVEHK